MIGGQGAPENQCVLVPNAQRGGGGSLLQGLGAPEAASWKRAAAVPSEQLHDEVASDPSSTSGDLLPNMKRAADTSAEELRDRDDKTQWCQR